MRKSFDKFAVEAAARRYVPYNTCSIANLAVRRRVLRTTVKHPEYGRRFSMTDEPPVMSMRRRVQYRDLPSQSSLSPKTKAHYEVSAAPNLHRWQHLYPFNDRQLALHFVHEAERLGFSALVVVSVDSPFVATNSTKMQEIFEGDDMKNNPLFR